MRNIDKLRQHGYLVLEPGNKLRSSGCTIVAYCNQTGRKEQVEYVIESSSTIKFLSYGKEVHDLDSIMRL